jgi:hypothetical protein
MMTRHVLGVADSNICGCDRTCHDRVRGDRFDRGDCGVKNLTLARMVAFCITLLVFASFAMPQTTAVQASSPMGLCGQDSPYDKRHEMKLRQPQIAYVLSTNNERIDVFKTMTIFGYPSGGIVFLIRLGRGLSPVTSVQSGHPQASSNIRSSTPWTHFFDSWGDFQNQRRKAADIFNL